MSFKQYKRIGFIEARPYISGEDLTKVSVSDVDNDLLSAGLAEGSMIARDSNNHDDQWFIRRSFWDKNYEQTPTGIITEHPGQTKIEFKD